MTQLWVVELCTDSGTPFRYSSPRTKEEADKMAKTMKEHFKVNVVPAEKYKVEPQKVEKEEYRVGKKGKIRD